LRAVRLFVYFLLFSTQFWIELRLVLFSALLFNFQGPMRCSREALDYDTIGVRVCQRLFSSLSVGRNPRKDWYQGISGQPFCRPDIEFITHTGLCQPKIRYFFFFFSDTLKLPHIYVFILWYLYFVSR